LLSQAFSTVQQAKSAAQHLAAAIYGMCCGEAMSISFTKCAKMSEKQGLNLR